MNVRALGILLAAVFGSAEAYSEGLEYEGVARRSDGKIAYIEKHKLTYENGKIVQASTRYESPDGKRIAELNSDFRKSLSVPEHKAEDFRSGMILGLRRTKDGAATMFFQEKGQSEQSKAIQEESRDDAILVAGQGLNYYILDKMDALDPQKTYLVRFLIPGNLDSYDFELRQFGDPAGPFAEFEIKPKSWLLGLFAEPLRVRYDRKSKRLLRYEGISNIKDEKGKNQEVIITYHDHKGR